MGRWWGDTRRSWPRRKNFAELIDAKTLRRRRGRWCRVGPQPAAHFEPNPRERSGIEPHDPPGPDDGEDRSKASVFWANAAIARNE